MSIAEADEGQQAPQAPALAPPVSPEEAWEALDLREQLAFILERVHRSQWFDDEYLQVLIAHCHSSITWGQIKSRFQHIGGNAFDLEQVAKEVRASLTQTRRAQAAARQGTDQAGPGPALPLSDYTNALAFVQDHGEDVRYCEAWGKWFHWTGTHWAHEAQGPIMQKAKQTVKRLLRDAEHVAEEDVSTLMRHVKKSLSTASLKALVESAQNEPGVPVRAEDLNQQPWVLNCANGTLDLRTGILLDHTREHLLTECLSVDYDADATCPQWETFLDRIMASNQALISFLQRTIGYALTGVIREHILPILYGEGSNGKSTFLNTLRELLGAYAMKAPSELLIVSYTDRHPTERADLFGKRLVAVIETEEGRRLAETFVKEATGGDPIRARRMREDFWEFQPTHKLLLATNHKPQIVNTDHAIWRRIRLIPFTVSIPDADQDHELPAKLRAEWPGILAWAVRGCRAWQDHGLGEPAEVILATKGYREEEDVIGQFVQACCQEGPTMKVRADALYDAYTHWGGTATKRTFGRKLTERGYDRYTNNGPWYRGIGLTQRPDDQRTDHPSTDGTDGTDVKNGINSSEIPREGVKPGNSIRSSVPSVGSEVDLNACEEASPASAPRSSLDGQAPPSTTGLQPSEGSSRIGSQMSAEQALACVPLDAPPQFCPGCGIGNARETRTTWLMRPGYWECCKRQCGYKMPRAVAS